MAPPFSELLYSCLFFSQNVLIEILAIVLLKFSFTFASCPCVLLHKFRIFLTERLFAGTDFVQVSFIRGELQVLFFISPSILEYSFSFHLKPAGEFILRFLPSLAISLVTAAPSLVKMAEPCCTAVVAAE